MRILVLQVVDKMCQQRRSKYPTVVGSEYIEVDVIPENHTIAKWYDGEYTRHVERDGAFHTPYGDFPNGEVARKISDLRSQIFKMKGLIETQGQAMTEQGDWYNLPMSESALKNNSEIEKIISELNAEIEALSSMPYVCYFSRDGFSEHVETLKNSPTISIEANAAIDVVDTDAVDVVAVEEVDIFAIKEWRKAFKSAQKAVEIAAKKGKDTAQLQKEVDDLFLTKPLGY